MIDGRAVGWRGRERGWGGGVLGKKRKYNGKNNEDWSVKSSVKKDGGNKSDVMLFGRRLF